MKPRIEKPPLPTHSLSFDLLVVVMLVLIMSTAAAVVVIRTRNAQRFVERNALVSYATQDLMQQVRRDLDSAVKLFHNDARGRAYLGRLDRRKAPLLNGARLPLLKPRGSFEPDVDGREKTGNVLLFAMFDRVQTFKLVEDDSVEEVRVYVYRLLAYYLRRIPGAGWADEPRGLDLVRWVSEPLVDSEMLNEITDDTKKEAILAHLYNGTTPSDSDIRFEAARLLWRIGEPVQSAFREIRPDGSTSRIDVGFRVPMDERESRSDTLAHKGMSVAISKPGSGRGVARFGRVTGMGDGFPHGLEVQIIGPAASRQVLIHLKVVSMDSDREQPSLDVQSVVDVRDV